MMNDLISRQEAISLPVKPKEDRFFQTQNLDDAYDYGWRDLQGCIEKMPSVQPSSSCAHENDTISRQAAIDALNKEIIKRRLLDDVNDGMLDEFDTEDILRKLPSAQPASYQQVTGKLDCISRQAALDALEKVAELFPWKVPGNRDSYDRYNEAWNDAIGRAEIEIEELPSAQPEIINCRDCKYHIDGFFCQVANHHTSDKDCCASVFGAERRKG